jgi:hypothetical protein
MQFAERLARQFVRIRPMGFTTDTKNGILATKKISMKTSSAGLAKEKTGSSLIFILFGSVDFPASAAVRLPHIC